MKESMEKTQPETTIIDRIRYIISQAKMTQAEFANRIGVNPTNLSKHLSGRLPITQGLINRIVVDMGVSKQWLVDGSDVPFSKRGSVPAYGAMTDAVGGRMNSIPVYDIDVTAGNENLAAMFTEDRISGYITLPRLSSDSLIVHVSGDSMMPEIIDGGMVAITPVTNVQTILWGQIYVVVTEDFRRVKYLRRHPSNPELLILHSANPNYDDVEIPRESIRQLFRVEAILNYKICG